MSATRPRVAHLTSVHDPSDTRITHRECFSLAQVGYDVVLIATGAQPPLPPGVRYVGVKKPRNRVERILFTTWRIYAAAVRERAAIYHFHDPELIFVGLALRARGARVIFDVHEDIPQDIQEKFWIPAPVRAPIAAASAILLAALQRAYTAIVAPTPGIAQRFTRGNTVIVCNYPRIDELQQRDALSFPERPRSVVYLGAITESRCVEEMVTAMESPDLERDVRLTFAGTFDDDRVERRIKAMPGFAQVDFIGHCPRSQIAAVLGRARAGIMLFRPAANLERTEPTKLFEYLGSGLPMIISKSHRYSALVKEHDCGIVVDQGDPHDIARAISFLVNHPDVAQAMGERGRRLITNHYQWTTEAAKLTDLYARIA